MALDKTKAELAEENEALKQDIVNMSAARAELEEALQSLVHRIDDMEQAFDERASRGENVDPAPQVHYDPFDEQNPHVILKHPEGFVLSWKNPDLRAKQGWKGWVPVTYDDEIGQNIDQYLSDPPPRMEGTAQLDNYVRRGTDSILCKLPADLWETRQRKRVERSKYKMRASQQPGGQTDGRFSYYGDGGRQHASADNTPIRPDGGPNSVHQRGRKFIADD